VETDLVASASESEALLQVLTLVEPGVQSLLSTHVENYGELLITVHLAELARWSLADPPRTRLLEAVNWLLVAGSPAVRNALLTGFVEGVAPDVDPDLVRALPEPLRFEVGRDLGMS